MPTSDPPITPIAAQAQLKGLRDLLADRWLELRAELHADEPAQREATDVAKHEVSDRKDEAAQRSLSGLDGAKSKAISTQWLKWKVPCVGSRAAPTAPARTAVSRS